MAKSKKKINPRDVPDDEIIVKSEAYGQHTRKKRKPGPVNNAMKESGKQLTQGARMASEIKQAVDPYRQDFYYGQSWSRLVTVYKAMVKEGIYDHSRLVGLDLHDDLRLERLTTLRATYRHEAGKVTYTLNLPARHPDFKKFGYIDGYCFSLLVLYFNDRKEIVSTDFQTLPVCSLRKPAPTALKHTFAAPADAVQFVLCVKLEGYERNSPCEANSKAMKFVLAGKFDSPAPAKTSRLKKPQKKT
ncbi:hypothetical protein [Dawidia soli]|uniref:Uncharacterized protein n=1 Tax=Dawidia soli TaxID=2782352 RepID=A0AAP2GFX1_9BACT|nr:hypothetical protein [Dawidia soli]MBT1685521.1 hypothetical protein [Dawidia soli]